MFCRGYDVFNTENEAINETLGKIIKLRESCKHYAIVGKIKHKITEEENGVRHTFYYCYNYPSSKIIHTESRSYLIKNY